MSYLGGVVVVDRRGHQEEPFSIIDTDNTSETEVKKITVDTIAGYWQGFMKMVFRFLSGYTGETAYVRVLVFGSNDGSTVDATVFDRTYSTNETLREVTLDLGVANMGYRYLVVSIRFWATRAGYADLWVDNLSVLLFRTAQA